jgi:hypothetical protein
MDLLGLGSLTATVNDFVHDLQGNNEGKTGEKQLRSAAECKDDANRGYFRKTSLHVNALHFETMLCHK